MRNSRRQGHVSKHWMFLNCLTFCHQSVSVFGFMNWSVRSALVLPLQNSATHAWFQQCMQIHVLIFYWCCKYVGTRELQWPQPMQCFWNTENCLSHKLLSCGAKSHLELFFCNFEGSDAFLQSKDSGCYSWETSNNPSFLLGRQAAIFAKDGQPVGYLGIVHPEVSKANHRLNWDNESKIYHTHQLLQYQAFKHHMHDQQLLDDKFAQISVGFLHW